MSRFPENKVVDKIKAERKQAEIRWLQRQAEHRWAQQVQKEKKDAERRLIIKRWVEQRKALQKPAPSLAELKEAGKRMVEESQAEQRWREWVQEQRAQWEADQRRKEELDTSKKKRDLQENRTRHARVLESPTIWEELNMMDDLLEEMADIRPTSMSPIHQPVSPPLVKDAASCMGLTTKPLEAKARHSHRVLEPTCTRLPQASHSCIPPLASQGLRLSEKTSDEHTSEGDTSDEERSPSLTSEFVETLSLACETSSVQQQNSLLCLPSAAQAKAAERLDYGRIILRDEAKDAVKEEETSATGLQKMQLRDPSIEETLNGEMLKKMGEEKTGKGKPAKKERECIEKQKKAEEQEQEEMEKEQRKQLERAEKRNMEIRTKLEREKRKMKDLERKEMQRLTEEERKKRIKKEKEDKKAEKARLEMDSHRKCCGFFEKVKRAFKFHQ